MHVHLHACPHIGEIGCTILFSGVSSGGRQCLSHCLVLCFGNSIRHFAFGSVPHAQEPFFFQTSFFLPGRCPYSNAVIYSDKRLTKGAKIWFRLAVSLFGGGAQPPWSMMSPSLGPPWAHGGAGWVCLLAFSLCTQFFVVCRFMGIGFQHLLGDWRRSSRSDSKFKS